MKLRNKKTGEIREAVARKDGIYVKANWSDEEAWFLYDLNVLANGWDYYVEPAEPLIKDKKIRKAVRAWAEANYIVKDGYNNCKVEFDWGEHRLKWIETSIEFNEITGLENLEDGEVYTIAELCGEEKELATMI